MNDSDIYTVWKPKYVHTDSVKHPSKVYESEHMSSVEPPKIQINLNIKPYFSILDKR